MPKISDIQETPNPNAVKFILREPLTSGVGRQFASNDQAQSDPLAKSLFDVGSVVREKIENYPAEKLESLVMSVAKEHLRVIEVFGALFGFFIGVVQAVQFYFYAHK